jgi:hypothetical protein
MFTALFSGDYTDARPISLFARPLGLARHFSLTHRRPDYGRRNERAASEWRNGLCKINSVTPLAGANYANTPLRYHLIASRRGA